MIRYKFYYPGNEYTNFHIAPDGEWVRYYDIVNTWRDWVDKHGRLSLIIRDLCLQVNKLQLEVSKLEEENNCLKRILDKNHVEVRI